MHQKHLRKQPQSSRSTGTRLTQEGVKSAASSLHSSEQEDSYCSSLRSSELHSEGTSVNFERLLDDKQAFYEAKQAAMDRITSVARTSAAKETARSQESEQEHGLAHLDSTIGASRQSLRHTQGELLRENSTQVKETSAQCTTNRSKGETDPICRSYPVHHAAEINVVEKKGSFGKNKYIAVRSYKEGEDRRPRTQGYGIQMSMDEAQQIVGNTYTPVDKENDDTKSMRSTQGSAYSNTNTNINTNSFKPSKRLIQQRRRSSSVASTIGIGSAGLFHFGGTAATNSLHVTGRTTAQEMGGYAHPAAMKIVLEEKRTEDGAFHHNTKSDISEYAEARVKFSVIHNVM